MEWSYMDKVTWSIAMGTRYPLKIVRVGEVP